MEPMGHENDSVSPADCADQAIRGGGDTVVNGKDRYVLQGSHPGMNSDHPHDGSRRTSSGLAGTQLGQPGSGPMSLWQEAMSHAVDQARAAADWGDVPIGAVLLDPNGRVLAAGANERELTGDPTAHAEVVTIRRGVEALQARDEDDGWHLDDCTLVVTLEPCTMCAGAIVAARVGTLVFGAFDPKAGAVSSLWDVVRDPRLNHRVRVVSQVCDQECAGLLTEFFMTRR